MPYSLVLERASGTHIYSVQQELSLLTSTCSVVCLLPQVHSNKLRLAALEALCFILFGALQRSGKEWSYIWPPDNPPWMMLNSVGVPPFNFSKVTNSQIVLGE